jgi:phospholipid/cholesterol/gamma-HCH transport system ATP-binding protein
MRAFSAVMLTVENLEVLNEKIGRVAAQIMLKNFAVQIKQRLDITNSCSRYSQDRIKVLARAESKDSRYLEFKMAEECSGTVILVRLKINFSVDKPFLACS